MASRQPADLYPSLQSPPQTPSRRIYQNHDFSPRRNEEILRTYGFGTTPPLTPSRRIRRAPDPLALRNDETLGAVKLGAISGQNNLMTTRRGGNPESWVTWPVGIHSRSVGLRSWAEAVGVLAMLYWALKLLQSIIPYETSIHLRWLAYSFLRNIGGSMALGVALTVTVQRLWAAHQENSNAQPRTPHTQRSLF